jgi:2-polyprenyl-6-methoxyphenol hydroxylase-like FAD-dependent oxidoreductase
MTAQQIKIAIVGGGPGGLTLARLLQLKGAEVKVYERDVNRDVRVQGATLDLHEESGLAALEKCGLMDTFKANYRPGAEMMRLTDQQSRIFYDEHTKEKAEHFGGQFARPEIDRGPLRNILLDSLKTHTVVWNSYFVSMEKQMDGWLLQFKNNSSAYADLVIGADGANSRVRPYVTTLKLFYVGVSAVEGNVYESETAAPAMHQLLRGGKIFAFGGSKTLIVSSKGDGSITFYTSFKTDEDWVTRCGVDFTNKDEVFAWFRKDYSDWSPAWQELFEKASVPFMPRQIYCVPLDQSWMPLTNLTLLGDAAHLLPPFAGEGVNMAMLDALEFSECLNFDDIPSSIVIYEKQMRKRTAEVAQASLDNTAWMHEENALAMMLEMFNAAPEQ